MSDGGWTTLAPVARPDVELAVFGRGRSDGPTLLLVHGWPNTHRMWDGVAARLEGDFRLVAYDTRGQGGSRTDAPDEAFVLPELADDLDAVAASVGGGRPVHVVAHDWGSVQAWASVCRPGAAGRIASFTSISGPHLGHVREWLGEVVRRPTAKGLAGVAAQAVSSAYVPFLVSPLAPLVLGAVGTPDMVSGLRYYRANTRLRGDRDGTAARTEVPVQQLALTRDVAIRQSSLVASDAHATRLERHRLPFGHWAPMTRPGPIATEVARFVRSVSSSVSTTEA